MFSELVLQFMDDGEPGPLSDWFELNGRPWAARWMRLTSFGPADREALLRESAGKPITETAACKWLHWRRPDGVTREDFVIESGLEPPGQ